MVFVAEECPCSGVGAVRLPNVAIVPIVDAVCDNGEKLSARRCYPVDDNARGCRIVKLHGGTEDAGSDRLGSIQRCICPEKMILLLVIIPELPRYEKDFISSNCQSGDICGVLRRRENFSRASRRAVAPPQLAEALCLVLHNEEK